MKLIKAIIQPYKLSDVKEALAEAGITKMTVTSALGCGQQQGYSEEYRGVIHDVNLLKKTVIEIAINDTFVDKTVAAIIKGARTDAIGDGKIFVFDLPHAIRIRTGEKGNDAIG